MHLVIYRGEYTGNKGGQFWTVVPEFARQFTQSGQEHELLTRQIDGDAVYKPAESIYAGDPDAIDRVVAIARSKGFKAVELSEGSGQPNSIYVFDKTALKAAPAAEDTTMAETKLTDDENGLLVWLGEEEYNQYGECHGATLDSLIAKGLAQLHEGREFQAGFIAKGDSKMHQAVSLTEKGRKARQEHMKSAAPASPAV